MRGVKIPLMSVDQPMSSARRGAEEALLDEAEVVLSEMIMLLEVEGSPLGFPEGGDTLVAMWHGKNRFPEGLTEAMHMKGT